MTINPFTDRYKSYTTVQLLQILDSKQDYEPLAVETAQAELDSRQLLSSQLAEAQQIFELQKQEKVRQQEKTNVIINKIKSAGSPFLENVNPIQAAAPTTEKSIKAICIFFGLQFLYILYTQFSLASFMLTDRTAKWDFSVLLIFLPLILIPAATVLFWLKKKPGWTLLSIHLTYSAFNVLYLLIAELSRQPSGIPAIDNLFPSTSPAVYIGQIISFGSVLAYICRPLIRDVYHVDRKHMFLSLGIVGALTTIQWWELLVH